MFWCGLTTNTEAWSIFSSWCLYVIIRTCNPSVLPLSMDSTRTVTQLKTPVTFRRRHHADMFLHLLFKAVLWRRQRVRYHVVLSVKMSWKHKAWCFTVCVFAATVLRHYGCNNIIPEIWPDSKDSMLPISTDSRELSSPRASQTAGRVIITAASLNMWSVDPERVADCSSSDSYFTCDNQLALYCLNTRIYEY